MAETTGWRRPELRPRQQQGGGGPLLLLLLLLEEAAAAPAVSCPELLLARPPASHHLHRAVVDHRHHADLRQRGEQEEACLAGARLHPPRLVLLRRLPGVFNSFHSFLSLTMPSTTKTSNQPFPASRPHLCAWPWQQQRLQRRVLVRDHQPSRRSTSKSTNSAAHRSWTAMNGLEWAVIYEI